MNYELTLLKNASTLTKSVSLCRRSAQLLAMKSYDTAGWRNGTFGQIAAIEDLLKLADNLQQLCKLIKHSLLLVPRPERALLVAVYVRNLHKKEVAKRYGVSLSTVYRKLYLSRKCFAQMLSRLGLTEEVFENEYGDLNMQGDWVSVTT